MSINSKSAPAFFPETYEFWAALKQGTLLVKTCLSCQQSHFYPRVYCPLCGSSRTQWQVASGRGTVYSFSIPRKAKPPVASAVIELEGGVRLHSVIREADLFGLKIDQPVIVYPRISGDEVALAFTTVAAEEARAYSRRISDAAADIPGLHPLHDRTCSKAAVIGAGTMGIGITMALVNAGIPTVLIDIDDVAVERGMAKIRERYSASVAREHLDAHTVNQRLELISVSTSYEAVGDADAVIEAVWEQMELKQAVFAQIDTYAKPGALLGTNTSGLDVNAIASATNRPQDVIGLHFFTPAQSMKLLEVVRGRVTSDATISRAMSLGYKLGKIAVLVESCSGFVGNRIFRQREMQARALLLEGASPEQIDQLLMEFGMPMGCFELQDMTGTVELLYRRRQTEGGTDWLGDRMYEAGRLGQKTGKGYYRYEPGNRKPMPDPDLQPLLEAASRQAGINRRRIEDDEVMERLILPMINESCRLIDEGVVGQATDVDAVWLHGYGWPTWRGGILYYADQLGATHVCKRLQSLSEQHGNAFKPAPLLSQVAAAGGRLTELPPRTQRSVAFS